MFEITFFHKGTSSRVYAIWAYLNEESDNVAIEVFDFFGQNYYIGIYDSDGGCIQGDELNIPNDVDKNNIINTVLEKIQKHLSDTDPFKEQLKEEIAVIKPVIQEISGKTIKKIKSKELPEGFNLVSYSEDYYGLEYKHLTVDILIENKVAVPADEYEIYNDCDSYIGTINPETFKIWKNKDTNQWITGNKCLPS